MKDLFKLANSPKNLEFCRRIMQTLDLDIYTPTILGNLERGEPDIRSLLAYLASELKPARYLEIGVRRGFSMAMVAGQLKDAELYGVDAWQNEYAGAPNPGLEFVQGQLKRVGHTGKVNLLSGNSHVILPQLFTDNPNLSFLLILVDADGSTDGTLADIRDCLPHLPEGGYLIVDDLDYKPRGIAWEQIQAEMPGVEYLAAGRVGVIHRPTTKANEAKPARRKKGK